LAQTSKPDLAQHECFTTHLALYHLHLQVGHATARSDCIQLATLLSCQLYIWLSLTTLSHSVLFRASYTTTLVPEVVPWADRITSARQLSLLALAVRICASTPRPHMRSISDARFFYAGIFRQSSDGPHTERWRTYSFQLGSMIGFSRHRTHCRVPLAVRLSPVSHHVLGIR